MLEMTLGEVAAAVGGRVVGDAGTPLRGVTTDSRAVAPGQLFVAIAGATHDGHDFAGQARELGAGATLCAREVDGPCVVVPDVIDALGRLARAHVETLDGVRVVAITGSSGKTGTKDLIARVLAAAGPTVAPPGSFNNEIGLPVTVLSATRRTRFLVLEMGMRGHGHIAYLCSIARPDIAVVTNIGSAHIELLGSREAIARAKGEIVEALGPGGVAVLNAEDALAWGLAKRAPGRVRGFGGTATVHAEDIELDALARPAFTLVTDEGRAAVRLALHGPHQVGNALAAAAVGREAGVPTGLIAEALSSAAADSRWRMEAAETAGGITVVNDAYNANPESMAAAMSTLAAMGGRRWAVLGEMRELGAHGERAHRDLGRAVATLGIDGLVAVGEGARPISDGAREADPAGEWVWVPDAEAAVAAVRERARRGDTVLVKASRAVGLERVADALLAASSGEDGGP